MIFRKHKNSLDQQAQMQADACLAAADSLEQVAASWVRSSSERVTFTTGIDDDERHTLVYVSLARNGVEAEYFIPLSEVLTRHPGMRPISDFISQVEDDSMPTLEIDDDALANYCGWKTEDVYEHSICGALLTHEQALPLITAYAIANVGEVTIEKAEFDDLFDDEERPALAQERNLLQVCLGYQASERVSGFLPGVTEFVYIDAGVSATEAAKS